MSNVIFTGENFALSPAAQSMLVASGGHVALRVEALLSDFELKRARQRGVSQRQVEATQTRNDATAARAWYEAQCRNLRQAPNPEQLGVLQNAIDAANRALTKATEDAANEGNGARDARAVVESVIQFLNAHAVKGVSHVVTA
jgi:hypothetical protein